MSPASAPAGPDSRAVFATTHWSLVLHSGAADGATSALNRLCLTYWPPLYAFARRRGQSAHDAQDSVQSFLAHLIESGAVARADPQRGRFRSFLLGAFQRHLAKEWERAQAVKRGGRIEFVEFDAQDFERAECAHAASPESAFEERWALTVVQQALAALEAEAAERGKAAVFAGLRPFLLGQADAADYPRAAAELGLDEKLLPTMLHRLRREFGTRLRREIAQTLDDPSEVEGELRHLREVLGQVLG